MYYFYFSSLSLYPVPLHLLTNIELCHMTSSLLDVNLSLSVFATLAPSLSSLSLSLSLCISMFMSV